MDNANTPPLSTDRFRNMINDEDYVEVEPLDMDDRYKEDVERVYDMFRHNRKQYDLFVDHVKAAIRGAQAMGVKYGFHELEKLLVAPGVAAVVVIEAIPRLLRVRESWPVATLAGLLQFPGIVMVAVVEGLKSWFQPENYKIAENVGKFLNTSLVMKILYRYVNTAKREQASLESDQPRASNAQPLPSVESSQ